MASKEINVVAIFYPKKGKTDEVVSLLTDVAKYTEDNEPDVLRYEVTRSLQPDKQGLEEVIMIERYENSKAFKAHGSSDKFKASQKKLGEADLLRAPMLLKMVAKTGGFSSRL